VVVWENAAVDKVSAKIANAARTLESLRSLFIVIKITPVVNRKYG
jgi:hypothetical protein